MSPPIQEGRTLMANEFDVLIKHLEVLEKIALKRNLQIDEIDQKSIVRVIQKFQYVGEQIMGDKFENISNSTIINRSLLSNSLNTVSSLYGDDVKKALEEISSHIEKSEDKESAELFNGFNQEINNGKQSKTVLKTLWNGLVSSLPDAAKVTTAIATISKIFT